MKSVTSHMCAECYDSPEQRRRRHEIKLQNWYGLSLASFEALLEMQQHRCALCGGTFGVGTKRSPAVDHDHVTNVIRGLIHQDCNRGLGLFDDNPILLDMAARYLRTARTAHTASAGKWFYRLRQQGQYRRRPKMK